MRASLLGTVLVAAARLVCTSTSSQSVPRDDIFVLQNPTQKIAFCGTFEAKYRLNADRINVTLRCRPGAT